MYGALAVVVLLCMSLAPIIAGGEAEYGSECSIANVAPLIEESSFFQSNQTICMGESVEFAISVSDANGAADVSSVMVMLSDDENISEDDLSIHLDRTGTVNATTSAVLSLSASDVIEARITHWDTADETTSSGTNKLFLHIVKVA